MIGTRFASTFAKYSSSCPHRGCRWGHLAIGSVGAVNGSGDTLTGETLRPADDEDDEELLDDDEDDELPVCDDIARYFAAAALSARVDE
jgi:hypothetical protein